MNIAGFQITRARQELSPARMWRRRTIAIIGGTTTVLMGTGIAYAVWSANGSGVGAAQAGTASPVNGSTQSVVISTASPLYPGATAPAVVNIHNGNAFPVVVKQVVTLPTASPSVAASPAPKSTSCTSANNAVSMLAATASPNITISPNSDASVTVPNAMTMGTGSDDGCQGAVFTFPTPAVSVSAASQ